MVLIRVHLSVCERLRKINICGGVMEWGENVSGPVTTTTERDVL